MIATIFAALGAFAAPARLLALLSGLILGFIAGIVPGLGGRIGLLLALPLAILFDPLSGAVFLIALHAVVHTSGSITPIAYGLPTSASEAATAIDGFQLQRKGRGAEALGASLSASTAGGLLGALVFMVAAPIVRPVVTSIGAPEFLALSLLGIALVATLSDRQPSGGLAVAALGVLVSTVGIDPLTAAPRFTFGRMELWSGLETISVIGGLFVIPEMLAVVQAPLRQEAPGRLPERRRMLAGMWEAFRHRAVMLRSTIIGIVVGIMPGVGSSVSVWIAYADAARHARSEVPFGQGALAGVIAPEAANNAKEGGALIPTVFFGIPGSSSMAILLGGFAMLGIDPGPSFLSTQFATAMAFGWTVILANLLTVPLFLWVVPHIVRFTALNPSGIVPFALIAIVTAALGSSTNAFGYAQFVLGGVFGTLVYLAGLPRAPFLLGFVVGPLIESSLGKTIVIFGPEAALRPGVILLALATVAALAGLRRPRVGPPEAAAAGSAPKRINWVAIALLAGLIAVGLAAFATAAGFKQSAGIAPMGAAAILIVAGSIALIGIRRQAAPEKPSFAAGSAAALAVFLALVPVIGLPPASLVFLALLHRKVSKRPLAILLSAAGIIAGEILMIEILLRRPLPMGYFGSGLLL
jgi:TctA family transporter